MQEYDTSQLDALCICLECGNSKSGDPTRAYTALGDWLVSVSSELIRPKIQLSSLSGEGWTLHSDIKDGDAHTCKLVPEQRFPYFVKRICKARIWYDNDGVLFKRLQAKAAQYMDDVAELCHARYGQLSIAGMMTFVVCVLFFAWYVHSTDVCSELKYS